MKSQIKILFIFILLSFSCNRAESDNFQIENSSSSHLTNKLPDDSLENLLNLENEYVDNYKITLSKCKTTYNANLDPVKYITITNNTGRSINGLEALGAQGERRIKVKIQMLANSSKAVKNSLLDCSSVLTGIFYANGEYESIASVESILGIKKNARPKTYRID